MEHDFNLLLSVTSGFAFRHLQKDNINQHGNADVQASKLPSAPFLHPPELSDVS